MSNLLLPRLAQLDSCAVSDALDALKMPGVALELRALTAAKRIVGSAVTVQLGPADGRVSARHLCSAAVESAGAGDIIVVAHNGRTDVAGWGGLLSLGAVTRGVEGVVVDGACRDIDEAADMGLPIYARVVVPVTARGRVVEYAWNVPVSVAGVAVDVGDLVIADGSGVAFIRGTQAEAVIVMAESIAHRERRMAADVRRGQPISQVMGRTYESMSTGEGA